MQAAAGAIVEEMVCRGLLMGYIEKKTNIRIAIVGTSLFWRDSFIEWCSKCYKFPFIVS